MKRWISLILVVGCLFLPATAFAEKPAPPLPKLELEFVEKPEWFFCEEQACMSFKDVKLLTLMRSQYVTLYRLAPLLMQEIQALQSVVDASTRVIEEQRKDYQKLFTVYNDAETHNKELLRSLEQEKLETQRSAIYQFALTSVVAFTLGILVYHSFAKSE